MLNVIMTAISVLTILGGAYIVAESFMSDSTFMRIHRRTAPAVERLFAVLNGLGMAAFDVARIDLAGARDKVRASRSKRGESYDELCRKYAATLPAFSDETKRIMQREGHWPTPQRITWGDLPHYGSKAPGLMRVWPKDYPPSTVKFQGSDTLSGEKPSTYMKRRYGQIANVKSNNETEAMRQMKVLQDMARNLSSARVDIKDGSHPMDKPSYASRIAREVVEVEEVEVTSKASAEVTVQGFERHYYKPIEEPDISRILLDKS